jgi:hypothetical protein
MASHLNFVDVRFVHKNRASNVHAHDLAKNSLDLMQGRRPWFLQSSDTTTVRLYPWLLSIKRELFPKKRLDV